MRFKLLTAAASLSALLLSSGTAMAQSQPYLAVEAPTTWKVDVGGGFVRGFSVTGTNANQTNFTFWGSANYRDIVYANGLDGVGWNVLKSDDFRAGVQLRPRFATGDIIGFDDRPGLGGDASLYAFKRLPGNIVVGGRIQQDVTGDNAGFSAQVSAGHQRVTPIGLLQVLGYARASDADRVNRYFGVTAREAAASGIPEFQGSGGMSAAGVGALLAVPIGTRYGVGTFVNYEKFLGDSARTPLREDDYIWRAGIIGVVRFNGM